MLLLFRSIGIVKILTKNYDNPTQNAEMQLLVLIFKNKSLKVCYNVVTAVHHVFISTTIDLNNYNNNDYPVIKILAHILKCNKHFLQNYNY